METGAISGYFDFAQLTLYVFWLFFAALIFYLHRENKREGYPLETSGGPKRRIKVVGFPSLPRPKSFVMPFDGGTSVAPSPKPHDEGRDIPEILYPGYPLATGNDPLSSGLGPGSWVNRPDVPDLLPEGEPRIVPMRVATEFAVAEQDPDPRGKPVYGADGLVAGQVVDIWVDRGEARIRFLELALGAGEDEPAENPAAEAELATSETAGAEDHAAERGETESSETESGESDESKGGVEAEGSAVEHESNSPASKRILLPINYANIRRADGSVQVTALLAHQMQGVPSIASDQQVTLLEEDKVAAFYGGGSLYASPERQEPLI